MGGHLQGYLDQFSLGRISGWSYNSRLKCGSPVSIWIDQAKLATLPATTNREDLKKLGYGDGNCAFSWDLPERFDDGRVHKLKVIQDESGLPLTNGEHTLAFEFNRAYLYSALLNQLIPNGLWTIDHVDRTDGRLNFSGWVVPPFNVPTSVRFSVNGQFAESAVFSPLRIDQFNTTVSAMKCSLPLSGDAATTDDLCFRVHFGPSGLSREEANIYYTFRPYPVPESERQKRVQSMHSDFFFNRTGCSVAHKLEGALKMFFGKSLAECGTVLDWGIGCGRVGRFIRDRVPGNLWGVDIDKENVLWCERNIPGIKVSVVRQDPPMPLEDSSVGLIYGISVLTHLNAADEQIWLKELARVLKPGGVALLSTHGETAWWWNQLIGPDAYVNWKKKGLMVFGTNDNLDNIGIDESRYLNTFTSRAHIHSTWSEHFSVGGVLDGYIDCYQDLVVLQSKK